MFNSEVSSTTEMMETFRSDQMRKYRTGWDQPWRVLTDWISPSPSQSMPRSRKQCVCLQLIPHHHLPLMCILHATNKSTEALVCVDVSHSAWPVLVLTSTVMNVNTDRALNFQCSYIFVPFSEWAGGKGDWWITGKRGTSKSVFVYVIRPAIVRTACWLCLYLVWMDRHLETVSREDKKKKNPKWDLSV